MKIFSNAEARLYKACKEGSVLSRLVTIKSHPFSPTIIKT